MRSLVNDHVTCQLKGDTLKGDRFTSELNHTNRLVRRGEYVLGFITYIPVGVGNTRVDGGAGGSRIILMVGIIGGNW